MKNLFDGNGQETPLEDRLKADIDQAGGPVDLDADCPGAIGYTMFDVPGSEDQTLTILLPESNLNKAPSQSLHRILSIDKRQYLAMVTAGPFAEPDTLRGDASVMVSSLARGARFRPPFHGRVRANILGEELNNGTLVPPRLRPLPHSPVVPLTEAEAAAVLKATGDMRLGVAYGFESIVVGVPSDRKDVLPRHLAVLGTTGGGKSTTIAGLVQQAQKAGIAVVLLDVEGEYARLHQPTSNQAMLAALADRRLEPEGLSKDRMTLFHLVGRESANPDHPRLHSFSLQFGRISPYAAMEISNLTEAQEQRFLKAYDIAKDMLRELGVFPSRGDAEEERFAAELDEFERGYPRLTLRFLRDVVEGIIRAGEKEEKADSSFRIHSAEMKRAGAKEAFQRRLPAKIDSLPSWRALAGKLGRLDRLGVFDADNAPPMKYKSLLQAGAVSVIDLSDSGMSELNSIVIADVLTGIQAAQDEAYSAYEAARKRGEAAAIPRTLIVIEEAHEFLSEDRIDKMRILFQQVAKIAKRGRKRWLGLVFVTQLPQHLPRQVLGLVNSFILHKISDPQVVASLRKTVSGIDEGLWSRLPGLAPGQAIASFPHMARPVLVAIDAARSELRMLD
ncbi:MAG: ATP-binding protein [Gemmataceae bacterium]|nr:ATP-binding protein [Gemmataceae bacterium]